ncbi:hypothetical protein BDW22DRAFT_1320462 [Trametopsis cervina]|nr:hypothetical protein BDW22DRAFT_1320462 [Trametopsis cervina]
MLLDLSQFINRRLTLPHHRFPKEEVPYMQAYSSVALHNDYYTYELQHFLAPFGSPTFHDFGDSPPRDVLDLGCGEGYWAAEAAIVWKAAGTVVTAFDIVDLGRPLRKALDPETQQRLIWVKGNFLKQGLPFPAKSFDLVRMANLTLAIPQDRWSHVLKEVKRVLRPGGIVEIVDDEVFFPSIQPAPSASHERTHSPDGGAARVAHPQDGAPTASPRRQSKAVNPTASGSRLSIPADVSDHRQRSIATRTMETVFQNMLLYEYNVSPTPHQFLEDEILKAFDGVTVKTKEVVIPKKDLGFRTVSDDGPSTPSASDMTTKGRKGRHSLDNNVTDFSPPAFVAPKAAQLLQLEAGNRGRYQPPGFIVLPDSFMPCDPDALEMHACHNIHLLLGCKDALGRYIEQQRSEDGEPLVSDEEFEELLFDYENFRRQRMNWPQNYPGVNLEEEPASPQRPMFSRKDLSIRNRPPSGLGMSMNVSVPKDAVIPVRRIRAFAGRKSDPKAAHVR